MFNALTTFENVKIGVESKQHTGPVGAMLRLPRTRRGAPERSAHPRAAEVRRAHTPGPMSFRARFPTGTGAGSRIAAHLGPIPRCSCSTSPLLGRTPAEKGELAELIRKVNSELGVTVLLIEHDMKLVMSVAQRIMTRARWIAQGSPVPGSDRDPVVINAYLGGRDGRGLMALLERSKTQRSATDCRPARLHHLGRPRRDRRLLGANGAGKTTTLRMISGLHHAALGSVSFDGVDITHSRPARPSSSGSATCPRAAASSLR